MFQISIKEIIDKKECLIKLEIKTRYRLITMKR